MHTKLNCMLSQDSIKSMYYMSVVQDITKGAYNENTQRKSHRKLLKYKLNITTTTQYNQYKKYTKLNFLQELQPSKRLGDGLFLGDFFRNINMNCITVVADQTDTLTFFQNLLVVYIAPIIDTIKKKCISQFNVEYKLPS